MPGSSSTVAIDFSEITQELTGKEILHGVSGHANKGELLAIMGPTGAGKSTLLNIIGQKNTGATSPMGGSLTYYSRKWSEAMRSNMGFVEQDDNILESLTVTEFITYSALLRLKNKTKAEKLERVAELIDLLNLDKCRDTLLSNVSGGERKRAAIANEIVTNPALLLLDEPTSGLDSCTALLIVRCLNALSKQGMCVVTTIHQPSVQSFKLLDKLLVLDNGYGVFFGASRMCKGFLSQAGFELPYEWSVPDYLMELIVSGKLSGGSEAVAQLKVTIGASDSSSNSSGNATTSEVSEETDTKTTGVRVHGGNGESEIVSNQISIELHTPAEQQQQKTTDITFDGIHDMDSDEITYALPFTGQVLTLMARQFRTVQAGLLSNVLLFQYVFLALLMGVLWLRLGYSEPYIFLRVSMIFWLVGTWMYFPSFESIFVFHMDMKMLKKELSVGAYSLEAYFVARSTLLIPLSLYWPLLFTTIAWWMSGMNDGFLVYVEFFLLIALVTITSQSFGLWVGSAFKMEHSVVACLSLMCVFFSYAGFLVPLALIPDALRWPQWISIMGHGFNVAMWIVFNQGEPPNHECAVPSTFAVCNEGQDYITTTDIFDFYLDGLTASDISTSIGLLFAMLVGFRVLAYLFLRRTVKQA